MDFKIKDIIKMGTGVGKLFLPGAAGKILDIVEKNINDNEDPANTESLRNLAKANDDIVEVLKNHEERLRKLEGKK